MKKKERRRIKKKDKKEEKKEKNKTKKKEEEEATISTCLGVYIVNLTCMHFAWIFHKHLYKNLLNLT